jgi:hypothetical protein
MNRPNIPITYLSATPVELQEFTIGELQFFINHAREHGFCDDDNVAWEWDDDLQRDRVTVSH